MILRTACPADAAAVSTLEAELFGPDAWSPALVEGELAHPLRRSVVAVAADAVVGYAIVSVAADTADLHRIGVGGRHRRRGVAAALLRALDLDDYPRVLLEVRVDNVPAVTLYEQHGFRVIGTRRGYYADGGDAVLMQRDGRPRECT